MLHRRGHSILRSEGEVSPRLTTEDPPSDPPLEFPFDHLQPQRGIVPRLIGCQPFELPPPQPPQFPITEGGEELHEKPGTVPVVVTVLAARHRRTTGSLRCSP